MSGATLPIKAGSQTHRLLALTTPKLTPLDELAPHTLSPNQYGHLVECARYLVSRHLLTTSGPRAARASYAITPEGQRVLALLGPL